MALILFEERFEGCECDFVRHDDFLLPQLMSLDCVAFSQVFTRFA
jgi:hypothetical protein